MISGEMAPSFLAALKLDQVIMWQPIETAPKDGTQVDLWVTLREYDRSFRAPNAKFMNGKWVRWEYAGWNELYGDITDWMPIPEAPAPKDLEEK